MAKTKEKLQLQILVLQRELDKLRYQLLGELNNEEAMRIDLKGQKRIFLQSKTTKYQITCKERQIRKLKVYWDVLVNQYREWEQHKTQLAALEQEAEEKIIELSQDSRDLEDKIALLPQQDVQRICLTLRLLEVGKQLIRQQSIHRRTVVTLGKHCEKKIFPAAPLVLEEEIEKAAARYEDSVRVIPKTDNFNKILTGTQEYAARKNEVTELSPFDNEDAIIAQQMKEAEEAKLRPKAIIG